MGNDSSAQPVPGTDIMAAVPKDHLRSLFYLFTGKPDSRIKVFSDPISIQKDDIVGLNTCITRKLAVHHIDAVVTTVKVSYEGSLLTEFGTWAEFTSHHWQEPECIEEVVVKWDFLVNIDNFKAPQRHTLLFRVSRDLKPAKLLQMMGAGNSDEFDNLDLISAPAFCRVDFINAQISKELINEVSDWHKGRKTPQLIPDHWYWFKKRRQTIAEIFDQWFILSWSLLLAAVLLRVSSYFYGGNPPISIACTAVFLSVYSLRPIGRISHRLGGRIFKTLAEIEGSRVVFDFTSGDKKRISKLKNDNSRQGHSFMWTSIWNILLNIVAAIIYARAFTSVEPQQSVPADAPGSGAPTLQQKHG